MAVTRAHSCLLMIAIIDYNAGNVRSVQRAFTHIQADARITSDPAVVARADRILFPGVGRAGSAMRSIRQNGLDVTLKDAFAAGTPILMICIGAQLVLDYSAEDETECLGLIPGQACRFNFSDTNLKIPHMGWNQVQQVQPHPLLTSLHPEDECYFANAYYPAPMGAQHCYAVSDHGGSFCAALGRDNLFATQFHPEKSGQIGLELLASFMRWDGTILPSC